MKKNDCRDKQVLVTGAASGIGYATAMAFAKCSANIVITDIDDFCLAAARKMIAARSGCRGALQKN
jgi:NAD(P)-dependent dehydrogenase (short-subunit alcohol dehydrogenase family)